MAKSHNDIRTLSSPGRSVKLTDLTENPVIGLPFEVEVYPLQLHMDPLGLLKISRTYRNPRLHTITFCLKKVILAYIDLSLYIKDHIWKRIFLNTNCSSGTGLSTPCPRGEQPRPKQASSHSNKVCFIKTEPFHTKR